MIDLGPTKAAIAGDFPPGHPGREALLALPDEIPESRFDAIFPILVRLLKTPWVGNGPARFAPPGHGGTDGAGQPRR